MRSTKTHQFWMWPNIPPLVFKITEQTVTTIFLKRKTKINTLNKIYANDSIFELSN